MQGGDEAMIYIGNFKKYSYISDISLAKLKNVSCCMEISA
jgi:hypothetical protein